MTKLNIFAKPVRVAGADTAFDNSEVVKPVDLPQQPEQEQVTWSKAGAMWGYTQTK